MQQIEPDSLQYVLLDLPGLLFFTTYTLLVLFWAEIYHQVRNPQKMLFTIAVTPCIDVLHFPLQHSTVPRSQCLGWFMSNSSPFDWLNKKRALSLCTIGDAKLQNYC